MTYRATMLAALVLAVLVLAAFPVAFPAVARSQTLPPTNVVVTFDDTLHRIPPGRISTARRIGATIGTLYVGLSVGHHIAGFGDDGKVFLWSQLGSMVGFTAALGMGFAGCYPQKDCINNRVGKSLMYASGVVYVGSRIWELVDVIVRPARHNARFNARSKTEPGKGLEFVIVPVLDAAECGLAATIRF